MTHLRTFVTTLFALAALTATTAFAQTADSTAEATVAAVNTLSVASGGAVTLAPELGTPATATPTVLDFVTNDGATYGIVLSVDGTGWTFTPGSGTPGANTYPTLSVNEATAEDGTASTGTTATGPLIDDGNVSSSVIVVSGLVNVTGTASITLGSSITETVVAGTYAASLTYTWTAQ